jgi:hypothetical protein
MELAKQIYEDGVNFEEFSDQDIRYFANWFYGIEVNVFNRYLFMDLFLNSPFTLYRYFNFTVQNFVHYTTSKHAAGPLLQKMFDLKDGTMPWSTLKMNINEYETDVGFLMYPIGYIALFKSLGALEMTSYRIGSWLNIFLGQGYALIEGSRLNISTFIFGPDRKTYLVQIFRTLYNMNKEYKLIFDYHEPINWRNLGIIIPIYSKNFKEDPDLIKLYKIKNYDAEGIYMNNTLISNKANNIKLQLSFFQCLSLLQHEFIDTYGVMYILTLLTIWNNKKENLLKATTDSWDTFYIVIKTVDFEYNPIKENKYENYEEEVQNEYDVINKYTKDKTILCSGPIFIGYLISLDNKGNVIPYYDIINLLHSYGIPIVLIYDLIANEDPTITSYPVYLKKDGWFQIGGKVSNSIFHYYGYYINFTNCNPYKKPGNNSCWEPQIHYERGKPKGFYFLNLSGATAHDSYNLLTCKGPLSEIEVVKNKEGKLTVTDPNNDLKVDNMKKKMKNDKKTVKNKKTVKKNKEPNKKSIKNRK